MSSKFSFKIATSKTVVAENFIDYENSAPIISNKYIIGLSDKKQYPIEINYQHKSIIIITNTSKIASYC
jgi:hypothetical protein